MRTLATREAVFKAAEAIARREGDPSSRAVRQEIGGGSLATIQRHLRVWNGEVRPGDGRSGGGAPIRAEAGGAASAREDIRRLTATVERLQRRVEDLAGDHEGEVETAAVKAERDAYRDRIARLSEQMDAVREDLARMTAARDAAEAEVAVCRQILNLDDEERTRLMRTAGGLEANEAPGGSG